MSLYHVYIASKPKAHSVIQGIALEVYQSWGY